LALAVAAPMLLAEDENHGPDLTGVWKQKFANGEHFALVTFHRDGTASFDSQGDIVFDIVQSHAHGLWKQTGDLTFIATFELLEYDRDANFVGTVILQVRYKLYPSGDQYDARRVATETLANGQVNTSPPLDAHGVRLHLIAPPF
jgi:hypothetical protein